MLKGRGVDSLEEYLNLERTGRRMPFTTAMRTQAWTLREEWDKRLREARIMDFPDVVREARDLARGHREPMYCAAIVDESQDLTLVGLQLVQALVARGNETVDDEAGKILVHAVTYGGSDWMARARSRHLMDLIRGARTSGIARCEVPITFLRGIPDLAIRPSGKASSTMTPRSTRIGQPSRTGSRNQSQGGMTLNALRILKRTGAAAAVAGLLAAGHGAQAETVLNVNMHSDLKIVDPIWTTAYMSRNYGYMVYDTLFAMNTKGEIKPQMVDSYTVSEDGKTYDFTLRGGLMFHDGQPVTSADVLASIKRWGAKDAMGQKMMSFVAEMTETGANSFRFTLNEPTGLIIQALGKPSSNVPFIMPARVAATPPGEQISEYVGSGPYVFLEDEWKPGDKAEFAKFEDYKPRDEPGDGLAGGKVVHVDKVVWKVIRDQQTKMNALSKGEIDVIESPSHDLLPLMEADPNIQLTDLNPFGNQYTFRYNSIHPPFNDPKMRQALMYAFSQEDFLFGAIGDEKYFKLCKAMFICGTPLDTSAGMEDKLEGNLEKARELVEEAGYDGSPVILMHPTDLAVLAPLPPIAKAAMEKIGINVDMQAMDWQTLVGRRNKRDKPEEGGWHAFITSWNSVDNASPLTTPFLNAACDKALFGWPCDDEIQALRDAFAREPDAAKQLAIAEKLQQRVAASPTHIHLGQWYQPTAMGTNISGAPVSPVAAFWGYKKEPK